MLIAAREGILRWTGKAGSIGRAPHYDIDFIRFSIRYNRWVTNLMYSLGRRAHLLLLSYVPTDMLL